MFGLHGARIAGFDFFGGRGVAIIADLANIADLGGRAEALTPDHHDAFFRDFTPDHHNAFFVGLSYLTTMRPTKMMIRFRGLCEGVFLFMRGIIGVLFFFV